MLLPARKYARQAPRITPRRLRLHMRKVTAGFNFPILSRRYLAENANITY